MATVEAVVGEAPAVQNGLRAICRRVCLPALRRVGERISLICRWLWSVREAAGRLDDERERREIDELRAALRRERAVTQGALADGHVTPGEHVLIVQARRATDGELGDLVAYNDREDAAHVAIINGVTSARDNAALASRVLDEAENAAANTRRSGEAVWAGVEITATTR